eukprot:SAG11_NODE_784_length_7187_cov_2.920429_3_plen_59_part_00
MMDKEMFEKDKAEAKMAEDEAAELMEQLHKDQVRDTQVCNQFASTKADSRRPVARTTR